MLRLPSSLMNTARPRKGNLQSLVSSRPRLRKESVRCQKLWSLGVHLAFLVPFTNSQSRPWQQQGRVPGLVMLMGAWCQAPLRSLAVQASDCAHRAAVLHPRSTSGSALPFPIYSLPLWHSLRLCCCYCYFHNPSRDLVHCTPVSMQLSGACNILLKVHASFA